MSIIWFDGFDYYNASAFGGGGRKYDQSSSGSVSTGRFGGQCLQTVGNGVYSLGTQGTLRSSDGTLRNCESLCVGYAMRVDGYVSAYGGVEYPSKPFFRFQDLGVVQASLWIDPTTQQIKVMTGDGISTPNTVFDSGYIPPLGLWFYLETKITFGNPGSVEIFVDGQSLGGATGQTVTIGGNYCNRFSFNSFNNYSGGVTGGSWLADDFYIIDSSDATGNIDVLGEVRVQTKLPDADGYQNDFLRSQGLVNAANVNTIPVTYLDTSKYNYSGTVGAIDLYSIANFTVTGSIFAIQENMSFKKDDVGNRSIAPILRTAAQNYTGGTKNCYSNYTYGAHIWEENPNTNLPWELTDLNLSEFGITVVS